MNKNEIKVLVTGGSGFLGKALIRELLRPDAPLSVGHVRVLDVADPPPELIANVEFIRGDVCDPEAVKQACVEMDIVFHCAAIVDWGVRSDAEVLAVNVEGTEHVINGCRKQGVPRLIHVSSLDAVYTGKPLVDIDEGQPYPTDFKTTYCKSKFLGEDRVLKANGPELQTVVLRPSDIFGEADPYHMGALINMARGGFYVRLGNGKSMCQHIYVGNMAIAMLQVAASMLDGNQKVLGQAYFITDGPGTNFFKFFDQIVLGAGYKIWPRNLWLPRWLAYSMGAMSEFMAWILRPVKRYNPGFSRFAVTYTCTDFTFTSEKALRDFSFTPKYTKEAAIARTAEYYSKERVGSRH